MADGSVLIAAGLPGYGKTHFVQNGIAARAIIIDPHAILDRSHGSAGKRSAWKGELYGYVSDLRPHRFDIIRAFDGRIVIDPESIDPNVVAERVSHLLEMIWAGGCCDVVLEEAGLYSRGAISMVNHFSTGAGHNFVRLFLIAQSLGRITIDARRNASHLALWPQSDPTDYRELRSKIGDDGIARLASLKPRDPPVTWKQGQVPMEVM